MAYYFRSPKIIDFTTDQRMALDEPKPIALSGGAGTGKTVVSLWRHRQNLTVLEKSSFLVTYAKPLAYYLEQNLDISSNKYVYNLKNFPQNNTFKVDEIIIDEAQDLICSKLQEISNHGNTVSYGADFNQQIHQRTVKDNELQALFPNNISYPLYENFRNTYRILNFVKSFLPNFFISQSSLDELLEDREGIQPMMFITNDFKTEITKIIGIINEFDADDHNIAILLPFGNSGEESVEHYHNALNERHIKCSKYYNEMQTDDIYIDKVHVTTFKSSKGLEFDTVIIPFLHKFKNFISRSHSTKTSEHDYYVALTRARDNLYLLSHQELNFICNTAVDIERIDTIPALKINESEIPF